MKYSEYSLKFMRASLHPKTSVDERKVHLFKKNFKKRQYLQKEMATKPQQQMEFAPIWQDRFCFDGQIIRTFSVDLRYWETLPYKKRAPGGVQGDTLTWNKPKIGWYMWYFEWENLVHFSLEWDVKYKNEVWLLLGPMCCAFWEREVLSSTGRYAVIALWQRASNCPAFMQRFITFFSSRNSSNNHQEDTNSRVHVLYLLNETINDV